MPSDASQIRDPDYIDAQFKMKESESYVIVVPMDNCPTVERVDITLKEAKEKINHKTLLERFNSNVPSEVATMKIVQVDKFILTKPNDDNKLIVLNRRLRRALTFKHGALFRKGTQKYLGAWFTEWDKPWIVSIFTLKKIVSFREVSVREVILSPRSFENRQDAILFINKKVNDKRIIFTCEKNNRMKLQIKDSSLKVTFDDNMRDIFAFENGTFTGSGLHKASEVFSLTRRIQHLYIYSNLTGFTRVGNTKAPLLAIVPFIPTDKCAQQPLKQMVFKIPMYVKLCSNRLAQIDVAIHDDAGQLVPFVSDAITTLHLHFRKS